MAWRVCLVGRRIRINQSPLPPLFLFGLYPADQDDYIWQQRINPAFGPGRDDPAPLLDYLYSTRLGAGTPPELGFMPAYDSLIIPQQNPQEFQYLLMSRIAPMPMMQPPPPALMMQPLPEYELQAHRQMLGETRFGGAAGNPDPLAYVSPFTPATLRHGGIGTNE